MQQWSIGKYYSKIQEIFLCAWPIQKRKGLCFDIINKTLRTCRKGLEGPHILKQHTHINVNTFYFRGCSSNPKFIILFIFNTLDQSSDKSNLHFNIVRTPTPQQPKIRPPPKAYNPYVHKPKSYSTKRNSVQDEFVQDLEVSLPIKKVKKQISVSPGVKRQCSLKMDQILWSQDSTESTKYFSAGFLTKNQQTGSSIKFPIEIGKKKVRNKNPMLKSNIDIISNSNEKLSVVIHDALLKANTFHKIEDSEDFQENIPNPYEVTRRDHYLARTSFQRDYKSGYAPIDLQMQNHDYQDNPNTGGGKSHFIKKKQSTLSLPRSCGVSYIKPSQSIQTTPYTPLPPLVFQCSSVFTATKQETEPYSEMIKSFITFCFNCTLPYIKCEQSEMRRLLLGQRIGEVGWVKGIENLWPCFADGYFFIILIDTSNPQTEEQVWNCLSTAIFKIGMLIKKSTSGRKAFFKSIDIGDKFETPCKDKDESSSNEKIPENLKGEQSSKIKEESKKEQSGYEKKIFDELRDQRAVSTLSIRLETYVQQFQWKKLDKEKKAMMFYLTIALKQALEKRSLQVITKRMEIDKSENREELTQFLNNIRKPMTSKSPTTMDEENQIIRIEPTQNINKENLSKLFHTKTQQQNAFENNIINATNPQNIQEISKRTATKGQNNWQRSLKLPLYYISTRDSFAFDLIEEVTHFDLNDRKYQRIKYYFDPENLPTNYSQEYRSRFPKFDVGVTCYHGFFSNEELKDFENNTFATEKNAFKSKFLQMTVQPSITTGKIKRTKFFFGYRYIWTRCQLAEPGAYIGAGVRKDVTDPPKWTNKIVKAFVGNKIAEPDFINSIAINVYHDGKQGLAQHFDDAVRFKQPIYTLRLFSDARLSFGSQFYGFCNGAFIIPLPRGCICVMEENSYAANGVKHCVRPCDMTGKSAAVILRQMHHQVVKQAAKFDELIEFPNWLSTLSDKQDSVPYSEQKRRESEVMINQGKNKKN